MNNIIILKKHAISYLSKFNASKNNLNRILHNKVRRMNLEKKDKFILYSSIASIIADLEINKLIDDKNFAQSIGREVCEKLKDLIPRHNFMIPVQAAIGGKIIARETIKGFKKDVLTKIHGGGARDRKRKLLDKQKKGKSRSKQFGKVEIPQEAFIGVLKINKI